MADITNAQAVKFANEELRTGAEADQSRLIQLRSQRDYYQTNLAGVFSGGDAGDLLVDGAPDDGRPSLTRGDVVTLLAQLSAQITQLETAGHETQRLKFAVRPPR